MLRFVVDSLFVLLKDLASYESTNVCPDICGVSAHDDLTTKQDVEFLKSPETSQDSLSSLATACLLSLVVATGDTSKILIALSEILMSVRVQACQNIQVSRTRGQVVLTLLNTKSNIV
jgi:hypothetical protein